MTFRNDPIVRSRLEPDWYKFTMGQFIWRRHPKAQATFAFRNRTKDVDLSKLISAQELQEELDVISRLRHTEAELDWLAKREVGGKPFFSGGYLGFRAATSLPEFRVTAAVKDFDIRTSGAWPEAMDNETLLLNVVNELHYRKVLERDGISLQTAWAEGERRLRAKIAALKCHPGIRIVEFGNRRHFSRDWHAHALKILLTEIPGQILGTSNVHFAKEFGIEPSGTMAHELFMAYARLYGDSDEAIRDSQRRLIDDWYEEYGAPLSTLLPDTFGSESVFRMMGPERAAKWNAFRHDSGDPFAFGERVIAFYRSHGIDPTTKTVVFSDGLTLDLIVRLHLHFGRRIKLVFGWGTHLTNDLGFRTLSLVMKLVQVNGLWTVKLSDNPEKATGDPDDIAAFKRIHGYAESAAQECIV
jgi:nicotinate phosphoribosyltransferase